MHLQRSEQLFNIITHHPIQLDQRLVSIAEDGLMPQLPSECSRKKSAAEPINGS
jgi:hypothetical protein